MPNWAFIGNGPKFQSLVNSLLLFEDPTNRVFGRPGRDGGLDARSQNGERIWQAKFHQRASISTAIADALAELDKIRRYRQPTDERYELWRNATRWTLVTNFLRNPNDQRRWDDEVVPIFVVIGLTAELWGEEQLEQLLVSYPEVERAFFGGENRCFLSLGEAYLILDSEGPRQHGLDIPIVGRDQDLNNLEVFFNGPKRIVCVHGTGGVGKSRLLYEFGCLLSQASNFQVLWGNVETLAQSGTWFNAVSNDRPTLLLLDEPTEPRFVVQLAEQMRNQLGPMAQWKVVIAMRSPKDPVLAAYASLSTTIRGDPYALNPPSQDQAKEIALREMEAGPLAHQSGEWKNAAAEHIAHITNGLPVWISLAVSVLETTGGLATLLRSVADIAKKYLEEVIQNSQERGATQEQIEGLIRWLALYRSVNTQRAELVEFLTSVLNFPTSTALQTALGSLVRRRFVVKRGVDRRLYEIKPDVMTEHILRDWLTVREDDVLYPSPEGEALVRMVCDGRNGQPLPDVSQILQMLAITEFRLKIQGEQIDLLGPLITDLKNVARTEPLTTQRAIIGRLSAFSFARLSDTLEVIRTLRDHPQPPIEVEGVFGGRELTHEDIIESLAWEVFTAGQHARNAQERNAVLDELESLFRAEALIANISRNGGKRVEDLLPRLLAGGRSFASSYAVEGFERAKMKLVSIASGAANSSVDLHFAETMVTPFVQAERSRTDFHGHTFNTTNWVIAPNGRDSQWRNQLRGTLRDLVESAQSEVRRLAWKLLSESHISANRTRDIDGNPFRGEILQDLNWVKEKIRPADASLEKLRQARAIWLWHSQFDEDPELRAIATECETLYQDHPTVTEFEVFFDFARHEEARERAAQVGRELAASAAGEIRDFVDRAAQFAAQNTHWQTFYTIAETMAPNWESNPGLEDYVEAGLRDSSNAQFGFAVSLLEYRLKLLRAAGNLQQVTAHLERAFMQLTSVERKQSFLNQLFFHPHPFRAGLLTTADLDFLLQKREQVDVQNQWYGTYRMLGCMYFVDWPRFQGVVEQLLQETPVEKKGNGFIQLFDGMHFISLFKDTLAIPYNVGHYDWLLKLLLNLPDVEVIGGQYEFYLDQMRDTFGRKPIIWLIEALQKRLDVKAADTSGLARLLPYQFMLSRLVETVTPENAAQPDVVAAMQALLTFKGRPDAIGSKLPEYVADVDPGGLVVAGLLISQIHAAPEAAAELAELASFIAAYPKNSVPWRRLAAAMTRAAASLPENEQSQLFFHFEDQTRSSSYASGQMDPQPGMERDECQAELEAETDPDLRPYRQWNLGRALRQYDHTVAHYQEEIGG